MELLKVGDCVEVMLVCPLGVDILFFPFCLLVYSFIPKDFAY